jgi:hypothetical protein
MKLFIDHNKKANQKKPMSRCCIAIFNQNNVFESVFCVDGNPEITGNTLQRNYDPGEVFDLMKCGDISYLGESLDQCSFYDSDFGCTRTFNGLDEMIDFYRECGCDYAYIFTYSSLEWGWTAYHIQPTGFSPVNLELLTNA